MAALGRELQKRGHCITFLQIPDVELKVRSEGLNFLAIGNANYRPGELKESFAQIGKLSGIEALRYSVNFCQHITAMICQDAPSVIQAAGIEALLVDQLEPAGETVAEFLNIPFIGVCCAQAIHRQADVPPFFTPWNYRNTWWARLRNLAAYHVLDQNSQPIQQVLNEYRQKWKLPLHQGFRVLILDLPKSANNLLLLISPAPTCQSVSTTLGHSAIHHRYQLDFLGKN
jgi:UDP:flavonoid glycosyltransferase YjiC (YdhE family)